MTIDNETRLKYAKAGVNFIVSRSVSTVISTILVQNMNSDEFNRRKKLQVAIGANVLGKVVADHTKHYVDEKFDSAIRIYEKAKKMIEDTDKPDDSPQD